MIRSGICLAFATGLGLLAACGPKPPPAAPRDLPGVSAAGLAAARALPAPYDTGDPVRGREAFALCADCHGLRPGTPQPKGPSLATIFGRPAARAPGFTYSEALRGSGFVWTARQLDQWIFNPHETLPGTSMGFIGVRNDAKRRDLVAYLAAVSADTDRP